MLLARSSCFVPAGAGSWVSGGVISGEQTRQVPALRGGWSLSAPGEMSQRHSHCKHASVVKATVDQWASARGNLGWFHPTVSL